MVAFALTFEIKVSLLSGFFSLEKFHQNVVGRYFDQKVQILMKKSKLKIWYFQALKMPRDRDMAIFMILGLFHWKSIRKVNGQFPLEIDQNIKVAVTLFLGL